MLNYILLITASILKIILTPLLYSYGVIKAYKKKELDKYNLELAISKDHYGNVLSNYLFNDILIKPEGYKFGNINETISSVLGKNKESNTLKVLGKFISKVLDLIDKNHVEKSIDNNIIK